MPNDPSPVSSISNTKSHLSNILTNGGSKSTAYYERIQKLSERLSGLQIGLENEKQGRIDQLSNKINLVDEKIDSTVASQNRRFNSIKDLLVQFQSDLESEKSTREATISSRDREVLNIEKRLNQMLEKEQQSRKQSESKIIQLAEEKMQVIRADLLKDDLVRNENLNHLRQYLDSDIPKLYDQLREEINSRENMENRLVKRATDEIQHLQETLLNEKKAKEETEEAMLRMIEDVVAKIQGEINAEKIEREATEETLLKLLEETCLKLNAATSGF